MKVLVTDGWRVDHATPAAVKKSQYWNLVP
jgi:hypothetical protein